MKTGLREEKKQATRVALREAALRLALERGAENVRVDDIAEAAGVSPRTYNNYFSSREQAIVAAVTAERDSRVAAAIAARPAGVRLADALAEAIVEEYTAPRDHDELLLITTSPALRETFLATATAIEEPLATAIDRRLTLAARGSAETGPPIAAGSASTGTPAAGISAPIARTSAPIAEVLAASVAAAVRVALRQWLQPLAASGLVVPAGSLPDLLRSAIAALEPALDAAEAPAERLRDR
ncbi:TetR/AcrR family transcriptional regulator [Kribbella sp. DT2]|uniref:TetR/AcrR family transcriptional regulator n=1 Tax=Kribbella sp. DT2 TaxID=3393427 RepID=UPI003CF0E826